MTKEQIPSSEWLRDLDERFSFSPDLFVTSKSRPKPKSRFFLDCDYNATSVLIPAKNRANWKKWLLDNKYSYKPKLPSYARKVKDYTRVEFSDYTIL